MVPKQVATSVAMNKTISSGHKQTLFYFNVSQANGVGNHRPKRQRILSVFVNIQDDLRSGKLNQDMPQLQGNLGSIMTTETLCNVMSCPVVVVVSLYYYLSLSKGS